MKAIPIKECSYCPYLKTYEIQTPNSDGKAIEHGLYCSIALTNVPPSALNVVHASQINWVDTSSIPDWCPLPDMEHTP